MGNKEQGGGQGEGNKGGGGEGRVDKHLVQIIKSEGKMSMG